jgi:uncharacterized protein (DUF1684 family)
MSSLEDFRRRKNDYFATDPHSPLTPEQQEGFEALAYFSENPDLDLTLEIEPIPGSRSVMLDTTTGEPAEYLVAGMLRFMVDGQEVSLALFRQPGRGRLFLPFRDATSGVESYAGGRYLDPQERPDGRVVVDFNYAYNPYCAYSDGWNCPIPPESNTLLVPIRAGERTFPLDSNQTGG